MNQLDSSPKCIQSSDFQTSKYILTDEKSFYYRFEKDLSEAKQEVIIESPFISCRLACIYHSTTDPDQ